MMKVFLMKYQNVYISTLAKNMVIQSFVKSFVLMIGMLMVF